VCGRNVEFFSVKPDIFMSFDHCVVIHKATSHKPNTTTIFFVKFYSIADLLVYVNSDGTWRNNWLCVISGFLRRVNDFCTLSGYYAVHNGSFIASFRDNLSVLSSRFVNMGCVIWDSTVVLMSVLMQRGISAILSDICTDMFYFKKKFCTVHINAILDQNWNWFKFFGA
jgi:hypothetical protein